VHTEALHSKRPGTQSMHLSENREMSKGLIWVSCSSPSKEHFLRCSCYWYLASCPENATCVPWPTDQPQK
jgi:hypothetical protein